MSKNILKDFVDEYKKTYLEEKIIYDEGLIGDIKRVQTFLLQEKFHPSNELKTLFKKLITKANYPIQIAITGQFSSGKSTFLNALLSKNILPVGITPVTSKVNFISYSDEYKLKISYYNGVEEFTNIESISKFTDQRSSELKDIKYLTLYAPMPILKDITFVDTPGLNSQSQSDTDTTINILKDVGGIIWLSLIDNAGKLSEEEILQEYMSNFKEKSLCVLNQKDKFTEEQIKTTTSYVSQKFDAYFAKVIPISAKQALQSRASHKDILVQNEYDEILTNFKNRLQKDSLDDFENDINSFKNRLIQIQKSDATNNIKLLEDSNINSVIDFIEENIRPKANDTKEFKIKNQLHFVCDTLINEYKTIIKVYDALVLVLKDCEDKVIKQFDNTLDKYSKESLNVFNSLDKTFETIAQEIYQNIKTKKLYRYENSKGNFLKGEKIERFEFETFWIDSDNILKNLFYDDQTVEKMFKKSIKLLKQIDIDSSESFLDAYRLIKKDVLKWQEPYELLRKHNEIASDMEFSNTRHFSAKIYENILNSYHRAILGNITALRKKFAYFNGALSYSSLQITLATISYFQEQILESQELYENEPTKFSISHPTQEELLTKLKANFSFEKIEDFLTSKRNYLYKIIEYSKQQYLDINSNRVEFVDSKKQEYISKIEEIEELKSSI